MPSGHEIKSTQRRERRIVVELDNTLAVVKGSQHVTATVNGVGDVDLALTDPFARAPIGSVSGMESDATGYLSALTVSSVKVNVTDLAALAADKACLVEIIGWDAVDEI